MASRIESLELPPTGETVSSRDLAQPLPGKLSDPHQYHARRLPEAVSATMRPGAGPFCVHDLKNAASAAFRVASFLAIIASQAVISVLSASMRSFSSWIYMS